MEKEVIGYYNSIIGTQLKIGNKVIAPKDWNKYMSQKEINKILTTTHDQLSIGLVVHYQEGGWHGCYIITNILKRKVELISFSGGDKSKTSRKDFFKYYSCKPQCDYNCKGIEYVGKIIKL